MPRRVAETGTTPAGGTRSLGIALALVSAAAFAIGPAAAKLAFDAGSNTLTVVALRSVFGVVLTGALIAWWGGGWRIGRRAAASCAGVGVASSVASYGFIGSVAHIPASMAVVIFFLHPLLIAVMWHALGRERLTARKLALASVALLGVALSVGGSFAQANLPGVALAGLAAVAICGVIYFSARAQEDAGSLLVNLHATAVSAIIFAGAATLLDAWALPSGALGWFGLVAAGLGVTIGLLGFLLAFRLIGVVRTTMLSNVEPLFGLAFAALLLGEALGTWQIAGVALVVGALLLFERRRPSRAEG